MLHLGFDFRGRDFLAASPWGDTSFVPMVRDPLAHKGDWGTLCAELFAPGRGKPDLTSLQKGLGRGGCRGRGFLCKRLGVNFLRCLRDHVKEFGEVKPRASTRLSGAPTGLVRSLSKENRSAG